VAQESGAPIEEAEVWLVVADTRVNTTRSDDKGHFLVTAAITGPSRLMIRRLGYRRREIPLEFPRDTVNALLIMLEATPALLPRVDVEAEGDEMAGWLREFNERRRTNRFGKYFTRETIKKSGKQQASEILRTTPGVTLSALRFGNAVRVRGCQMAPVIWLDGIRVPLAEFDEVSRAEDIAGLEVYLSGAGVPAAFMDRSNSDCGTIVIWTRHR
jgi:hypothetical protein